MVSQTWFVVPHWLRWVIETHLRILLFKIEFRARISVILLGKTPHSVRSHAPLFRLRSSSLQSWLILLQRSLWWLFLLWPLPILSHRWSSLLSKPTWECPIWLSWGALLWLSYRLRFPLLSKAQTHHTNSSLLMEVHYLWVHSICLILLILIEGALELLPDCLHILNNLCVLNAIQFREYWVPFRSDCFHPSRTDNTSKSSHLRLSCQQPIVKLAQISEELRVAPHRA